MRLATPRLVIAGTSGSSGKTLVAAGLVRALARRGVAVAAFKKGPDYIDAAWLGVAAGAPARNLDTFLMDGAAMARVLGAARGADLLLVEGNRGLHDGVDAEGTHSTAALARRLGAPVVLVVDTTRTTRTVAASVLGCRMLDPELELAGVILDRVGTARQETVIRAAVERHAGVPVLGAIPRLGGDDPLPDRHLGLVTAAERPEAEAVVDRLAETVARHVDLDAVLAVARRAGEVALPEPEPWPYRGAFRVAVARDAAFSFYYPELEEALVATGAEVVRFSPLADRALPAADLVVLGGGFPEVHAEALADNASLRADLRRAVVAGVPVYAECGGLMLLGRSLRVNGRAYPMAAALDLEVEQTPRPQGHGYVVGRIEGANPLLPRGFLVRGHEFHYSRVVGGADAARTALVLERGRGLGGGRDGVTRDRVWAAYLHLHPAATPELPAALAELALGGAGCAAGPGR